MAKRNALYKTSPKGIAAYPRLNTPDRKYKATGQYHCTVRLDGKDPRVQQFISELQEFDEQCYQEVCAQKGKKRLKRKDSPLRPVEDEDGNATNIWELRNRLDAHVETASGKSWDQRPIVFDSKLKPMDMENGPIVGGGSTVRIRVELYPSYTDNLGAGMACRLRSVQVIDLVEYVPGADPKQHGFDEEDGYEGEETPATAAKSPDTEGMEEEDY